MSGKDPKRHEAAAAEVNREVTVLEPSAPGLFAKGKVDPSEAGRKGAQVREERWLERQSQTREELMILAPKAVETIGGILDGDTPPNRLPASTAVLDRIGLGANVKHDLQVRGSDHLAAIILRLDAEERAELNGRPVGRNR